MSDQSQDESSGLGQRLLHFVEQSPAGGLWASPAGRGVRQAVLSLYLVWRGFTDNRCPMRAAGLAYTTLLALVPLLAVALSFSKGFLKEASADYVPRLLDTAIRYIAPQLSAVAGADASGQNQVVVTAEARAEVVRQIQRFIDGIDAGKLKTIGSVLLIVVAIQLMTTVENTFNDIWGVARGRSVWRKVVYYWTAVSLGPLLMLLAMYATGKVELLSATPAFESMRWIVRAGMTMMPYALVWFGFALMYGLMPNTQVRLGAAVIGGLVGGTLWQLNSKLSVLYMSRVTTYSTIYGGLGVLPVLLVGLYFSWLIVLFGAQVSFAAQNFRVYFQRRASDRVNQEGRELLACRVVHAAARSFLAGERAPSVEQLAEQLQVPSQLINQIVHRLAQAGLLTQVADSGNRLQPARPPGTIRVTDVLRAMRRNGHPVAPRDGAEPVEQVVGELHAAEQLAPANLTFAQLAERASIPS